MIRSAHMATFSGSRIGSGARHIGMVLVALVAFIVLPAARPVAAQDITAEITAENPAIGGAFTGSTGGAFRKYGVDYPGGPIIVATLDVNNAYNTMGNLLGFELYGPDGLVTRGEPTDGNRALNQARATFSRPTAGRYMIQVYSYVAGGTSNFTLTVSGLEGTTAVTGSENPETAPTVDAAAPLLAGSLTGTSGGSAAHYLVRYAGGDAELRVTMSYSPAYSSNEAIRLQLYDLDKLVAESNEVERVGRTSVHRLSHSAHTAVTFGLQVVNYVAGYRIDYSLEITGTGSEPVAIEGNTTADRAYVLTQATPSVTGTVQGTSGGSFVYFLVNHPGGNKTIRVAMTTEKDARVVTDGNLGLNLYRGSNLEQQNRASRDDQSRYGANVTMTSATAQTYGVQLFNYNPNVALKYTVNTVGW